MSQLLRIVAVLLLCRLAVDYAKRTPAVIPASAPAGEFSAERALTHVSRIASGPHPTGSAANDSVAAYITGAIRALGLTPQIQEATGIGTRYAVAGHVRNILVRVPGTQPGGRAVLLVAHYDGVGAGPAAGDDAAGSAALLETLRALRAGPALTHDVIVLWSDGEEAGLLGAAAFAREHPWAGDVDVILNFEARGVSGPSLMFETGAGNLDVARMLRDHADARATSLSTEVYRRLPNDTDLSELFRLDRPAMNFAFIGGVNRYHTSQDDVAHLEVGSVQHHGAQALALARAFGNGALPRPATPDAVFFFVPGLGTFVYAQSLAIWFALLALTLTAVAAVRRRAEDQERWASGILVGVLSSLLAPLIGGCLGWALGSQVVKLHASIGTGQPRMSEAYAAAVVLLTLAAVIPLHRLALRFRSSAGIEVGALVWWSVVAVGVSAFWPGVSFLFTWPVVAAAAAALIGADRPRLAATLRGLAAVVAVAFIAPTAYLMVVAALGLDAAGGAILGVLTAMGAALARPLLVTASDRWWPAAALAAAAVWELILGAATVRTNPDHPIGASLVFAIDADSGRAFGSGVSTGPVGALWVGKTIGGKHVDSREVPAWLRRFTGAGPVAKTQPYTTPLPPPRLTVLRDSSFGGERNVLVRVRPGAKNTLGIRLNVEGARVLAASVDGRSVDTTRYRRRTTAWVLDFIAPPDSGFTLGLRLDQVSSPTLGMASRVAGLVSWPVILAARPPEVVAFQNGDMSVVHTRASLTMPPSRAGGRGRR